jgi:hypothetical protein
MVWAHAVDVGLGELAGSRLQALYTGMAGK